MGYSNRHLLFRVTLWVAAPCHPLLQLKRKELSALETEVQERSTVLSGLESEAAALQHSINSTQYDRQRGLERLASIQVCVACACVFVWLVAKSPPPPPSLACSPLCHMHSMACLQW